MEILFSELPKMVQAGTCVHFNIAPDVIGSSYRFYSSLFPPEREDKIPSDYLLIGTKNELFYYCQERKADIVNEIIEEVGSGVVNVVASKNWLSAIPNLLKLISSIFGSKK